MDFKEWELKQKNLQPKADSQVLKFIYDIVDSYPTDDHADYDFAVDVIRNLFSNGYCYYFAKMLKDAFRRGDIYCLSSMDHIVWIDDNGVAYDIKGCNTTKVSSYIPCFLLEDMIKSFKHVSDNKQSVTDQQLAQIVVDWNDILLCEKNSQKPEYQDVVHMPLEEAASYFMKNKNSENVTTQKKIKYLILKFSEEKLKKEFESHKEKKNILSKMIGGYNPYYYDKNSCLYFNTESLLVNILGRVNISQKLIRVTADHIKQLYGKGYVLSKEELVDEIKQFCSSNNVFLGEYTQVNETDLPRYMINALCHIAYQRVGEELVEKDIVLDGFFSREEAFRALIAEIEGRRKSAVDNTYFIDISYKKRYASGNKQPFTKKQCIMALLGEDEEIFKFTTDSSYCSYYAIKPNGSTDIGSALEDTFVRLKDEYGLEIAAQVMHAKEISEIENPEECVPLDLGYYISGNILSVAC